MKSLRTTNWLLFGILFALLARLVLDTLSTTAMAGPYAAKPLIDWCITEHPNEKPAQYLHVVSHNFSGN